MLRLFTVAVALTFTLMSPAVGAPKTYKIDPDHAAIAFFVKHIGYARTLGQFLTTEGEFIYNEETQELGEVSIRVDAASVFSNHERRDGHIRNRDFLHVEEHPTITFTATGGEAASETSGTVTGDLTIRGVTRPVTLDVTLNRAAPYPFGHKRQTLGISARAVIKRSEFGMTYALPDLVGDEVELLIEVEAIQQD
ncbi:MAG: YceI family protein [Pseudomonadota bacterium]